MKKLQSGEEFDYSGWIWIPSNDNGKVTFKPIRESSAKKEKVKKSFIPPSPVDVLEYFTEKGYSQQSAAKFFDFYNVADWKDSNGKQIINWKQKAVGIWFKPENEIKSKQPTQQQEFFKEEL